MELWKEGKSSLLKWLWGGGGDSLAGGQMNPEPGKEKNFRKSFHIKKNFTSHQLSSWYWYWLSGFHTAFWVAVTQTTAPKPSVLRLLKAFYGWGLKEVQNKEEGKGQRGLQRKTGHGDVHVLKAYINIRG